MVCALKLKFISVCPGCYLRYPQVGAAPRIASKQANTLARQQQLQEGGREDAKSNHQGAHAADVRQAQQPSAVGLQDLKVLGLVHRPRSFTG